MDLLQLQKMYNAILLENAQLKDENQQLKVQLGIEIFKCDEKENQDTIISINKLHMHSNRNEKVAFFMSLFRGREDVYAKRWYSDKIKKSGYTPVCLNEWEQGICDKKKYKCHTCPNRKLAPLDTAAINGHLRGLDELGRDVIGIFPMLQDETTYILAVDFDDNSWQDDVTAFRKACKDLGLEVAIERSRSGNGAHAWFFFEEAIPAATARKFGRGLLTNAMSKRHEIKFKSMIGCFQIKIPCH